MDEELCARLERIEALLLVIVDALADDQDDGAEPQLSLDGDLLLGERDLGSPL